MRADSTREGSLFGGVLLIAGSCIGAGMLGLPILTGLCGFFPSLIAFFLSWAFMTATALLLVEVNSHFSRPVNLLTMVGQTLGRAGRLVCWLLYLFLFYALLVAYMSGSGNHVQSLSYHYLPFSIPDWGGTLFFVGLFGWIIFVGTRSVDLLNRMLMAGKIITFIFLIFIGVRYVKPHLLLESKPQYSLLALPILITSFGFHNMVPSLTNYMKGDLRRVRQAIIGGSLFTLVIYLIWETLALSILPLEGSGGIVASYLSDIDAAQAIKNYLGASVVGVLAQLLAFFAILTSLLAQALSLSHFLSDGFGWSHEGKESPWASLLTLLPPLIFTMIWPQLFFAALSFAGGFCAVILFGILPVLMVWIGRYRKGLVGGYRFKGGRVTLGLIFLFALFIFFFQLTQTFGLKIFPEPV